MLLVIRKNTNLLVLDLEKSEVMIPKEESLNCIEMKNFYILQPMLSWWDRKKIKPYIKKNGKKVLTPFEYSSENNDTFLKINEIKKTH